MRFIVSSLLLSIATQAYSKELKATLDFKPHHGMRQIYRIEIKKNALITNGRRIDPFSLIALNKDFALIVKPLPTERLHCRAGSYLHTVIRGGKKIARGGCIRDRRFPKLLRAFRRLDSSPSAR